MKLKKPLVAALMLFALSTSAFSGESLSGQDLRKLAPGRYAVSVLGLVNMTVSMRPNGMIVGQTSKGKRDTGMWSVQGERLCVSWTRWLNAKRRCTVLKGGNGNYSGGGMSLQRI